MLKYRRNGYHTGRTLSGLITRIFQAGHFRAGQNRLRALTIAAPLAAVALALTPDPTQAQFVCDTDAAGENGAGATAAGSVGNVACGTLANASGAGSSNTATG